MARGKTPAAAGLCNELFWALKARAGQAEEHWAGVALQELLRDIPSERELGLLRQHSWVRDMERGNYESCRVEPWGDSRKFPLAVWPPYRSCLGMEGLPKKTDSKSAPIVVRCRFHDEAASTSSPAPSPARGPRPSAASSIRPSSKEVSERRKSSGVLLKRDVGMHREQQVGQTLRLLEILIWEDPELHVLLRKSGLVFEDVRATYTIVMTGHGTAMLEHPACVKYGSVPFIPESTEVGVKIHGQRVHSMSSMCASMRGCARQTRELQAKQVNKTKPANLTTHPPTSRQLAHPSQPASHPSNHACVRTRLHAC